MVSNSDAFYIKKVVVNNFRGYKDKVTFSFENKDGKVPKLILLTGANGYGKTSLIDAIEWGFTGRISRLIKYLDNRVDRSDKDNKKNNDGLIININAENKITEVEIYVIYKGQSILVKRIFEGDLQESEVIKGNGSNFTIDCQDEEIRKEIESELLKFGNDNICSYDKNIDLYNKGRKDIYEMFSTLYSDNYDIKNIINNLESIKQYLQKKMDGIDSKVSEINVKIEEYKKIVDNSADEIMDIIYPQNTIYKSEIILDSSNISEVDINDIKNQIKALSNIRNLELHREINVILSMLCDNRQYVKKHELLNLLMSKGSVFKRFINIDFILIEEEIKELESIKKYMNSISSYNDLLSSTKYKEKIISLANKENIEKITEIRKDIDKLNKSLDLYTEDNSTVKVLRYVVDHIIEFKDYQSEYIECPLCGNRDSFKDAEIGKIAREILGKNDLERQNINDKIRALKNREDSIIITIKNDVLRLIERKILNIGKYLSEKKYVEDIRKLIIDLGEIYNDDLLLKLEKEVNGNTIRNIDNEGDIISYLYLKKYSFLYDLCKNMDSNNYSNLSIDNKISLLSTIVSRLDNILENCEYNKANVKELDTRIAICTSYMNKLNSNKLSQNIEQLEKEKSSKEEEFKLVKNKFDDTKRMITKVRKLKTENEQKQTELIQKPLDNIYRKITRNTNIKKIGLTRAKAGGSTELDIVDFNNNKTSFANILSAGQLSTLAISIFLAKASLNSENEVKIYLMDEPIQTMDDLNILSFIDLMKYQMIEDKSNSFINQVIFSTCDDNLSRLFTYKFDSFDIPICEYKFDGNTSPIKV